MKRSVRALRVGVAVAACALAAACMVHVKPTPPASSSATAAVAEGAAAQAATADVPPPAAGRAQDPSFLGVIAPPQAVNVAAQESGKLASVRVAVGMTVKAGDVLAQLDETVHKRELAAAQASVRAARAAAGGASVDLLSAREKSTRRVAAVDVGGRSVPIVSAEEQATARYDERSAASRAVSAHASVGLAEAKLERLKIEIEQLTLRAPFDGVVAACFVEAGSMVQQGTPIVRVLANGGHRIRFAVPEEAPDKTVSIGTTIDATVDGLHLRGAVEHVSPEVEPSSRTIFVDASIEGPHAALAGRVVRVRLERKTPTSEGDRP